MPDNLRKVDFLSRFPFTTKILLVFEGVDRKEFLSNFYELKSKDI